MAPETNLPRALARLGEVGRLVAVSRAYQSPAAGPAGQPDFVNASVLLETRLDPEGLRTRLRELEAELGRVRTADRFAPRPIDLDIVLYDALVQEMGEYTLPDPDLLVRPDLAVTLAELDPETVHPVTREPLVRLAARLAGDLTPRPDIDLALPAESD
jgi:2-amino-4-hydroxy-6-hydroxymethyldihydropteridine diphosphokinase